MSRGKVSQPSIDIAIDGPYGRSINYMQHSTVVLIAGKISCSEVLISVDGILLHTSPLIVFIAQAGLALPL